jgi:hypothetical protein
MVLSDIIVAQLLIVIYIELRESENASFEKLWRIFALIFFLILFTHILHARILLHVQVHNVLRAFLE